MKKVVSNSKTKTIRKLAKDDNLIKKQLSTKSKSRSTLMKMKKDERKRVNFKKKKIISKRDFLMEILKEYNLSKDIASFEKSVKKLFNERDYNLGKKSNFRFLFSKIFTKAYLKSKLTYDYTPKDLKFIKEIINKTMPSNASRQQTKRERTFAGSRIKDNCLKIASRLIGL